MEPNYSSLFNDIKVLITSFLAPADLYHLLQADKVLGQTPDVDALIHQYEIPSYLKEVYAKYVEVTESIEEYNTLISKFTKHVSSTLHSQVTEEMKKDSSVWDTISSYNPVKRSKA